MAEQIFETLAAEFREHIPHRHHTASAETPAATATIEPAPQEEPVSIVEELENDAKNLAAKFGQIDADAIEKASAIKATPEGALLFEALHELVAAEVPAGTLQVLTGIVKSFGSLVPAQPQAPAEQAPSFTPAPAGPQVGGQA